MKLEGHKTPLAEYNFSDKSFTATGRYPTVKIQGRDFLEDMKICFNQ